jgi:hypothetical protein
MSPKSDHLSTHRKRRNEDRAVLGFENGARLRFAAARAGACQVKIAASDGRLLQTLQHAAEKFSAGTLGRFLRQSFRPTGVSGSSARATGLLQSSQFAYESGQSCPEPRKRCVSACEQEGHLHKELLDVRSRTDILIVGLPWRSVAEP